MQFPNRKLLPIWRHAEVNPNVKEQIEAEKTQKRSMIFLEIKKSEQIFGNQKYAKVSVHRHLQCLPRKTVRREGRGRDTPHTDEVSGYAHTSRDLGGSRLAAAYRTHHGGRSNPRTIRLKSIGASVEGVLLSIPRDISRHGAPGEENPTA